MQYVDLDKKVLPKLYPVLEGKIRGSGSTPNVVMYSYFLPFLSGYPETTDDFYRHFFASFAEGMDEVLFKGPKPTTKGNTLVFAYKGRDLQDLDLPWVKD